MNGVTSERHIIGKYKVSFLRSVLSVGANNTVTTIIKIFIIKDSGMIDANSVFVLELFSDIILDRAVGYERVAMTLKRALVGASKL